jgi:hypothetical protein
MKECIYRENQREVRGKETSKEKRDEREKNN